MSGQPRYRQQTPLLRIHHGLQTWLPRTILPKTHALCHVPSCRTSNQAHLSPITHRLYSKDTQTFTQGEVMLSVPVPDFTKRFIFMCCYSGFDLVCVYLVFGFWILDLHYYCWFLIAWPLPVYCLHLYYTFWIYLLGPFNKTLNCSCIRFSLHFMTS